jgi:AcrR family transcriptional regulator
MKAEAHAGVGRPREFDVEEALSAALKVFWRKGYEGASLTDLTEAMGITRPSLYCAFGNKEALFKKTLDLYEREKLSFIDGALAAPTGREAIERFLNNACELYASDPETRGCMGVNSVLSCQGIASESVRQELVERRLDVESRLRIRLERAKAEGDLGLDADPAGLAMYVMTIGQGIALQAQMGASSATLKQVVCTALRACPCVKAEAAA